MIPNRILNGIEAIRRAMIDADGKQDGSFDRVFSAFLDLANDPALMQAHKITKEPVLRGALEATARAVVGDDKLVLQRVMMFRIAASGFVHGGFFAPPFLGSFFYFDREKQGLSAFHGDGLTTHFTRITMAELPPGTTPMKRPKGVQ